MTSIQARRPAAAISEEQRRIAHAMDDEKQANATPGYRTTPRAAATAEPNGKATAHIQPERPPQAG